MPKKNILLIFAHPDDETFSCSGTTIKSAKEGSEINLICATRGEAGEAGNPPVCFPEELGEQRTKEAYEAAKIEGIKNIFFLGLRDGTLDRFSTRFLAGLIKPVLERLKPDTVITFASHGISGHSDHIIISKAATLAFKKYHAKTKKAGLLHVTIPASIVEKMRRKGMVRDIFTKPFMGTPDKEISQTVDIKAHLPQKIKALKCHKSQHGDWELYLERINEGFSDNEYFVRVF